MYCKNCGVKLKIKALSNTYKKGDAKFSNYLLGHSTIGMDRIERVEYEYQCPKCNLIISYEDQCEIAKIQKKLKKRILTDEDMNGIALNQKPLL